MNKYVESIPLASFASKFLASITEKQESNQTLKQLFSTSNTNLNTTEMSSM